MLEQLHVQHAVTVFEAKKGPHYYGASADLQVFQLSGVSINQASTSQIILTKGERGPKNYINTVQAGWQVSNGLFFLKKNLLSFVMWHMELNAFG